MLLRKPLENSIVASYRLCKYSPGDMISNGRLAAFILGVLKSFLSKVIRIWTFWFSEASKMGMSLAIIIFAYFCIS